MNKETKWISYEMACGTVRHRLYRDSIETPYFVDKASVRAHFTSGQPVGLFGAGMSEKGFAATLGTFQTVAEAKANAEARS